MGEEKKLNTLPQQPEEQEIDLIEESTDSLTALEFKWENKIPSMPLAFQKAYPHASFQVVNRDNYLGFI